MRSTWAFILILSSTTVLSQIKELPVYETRAEDSNFKTSFRNNSDLKHGDSTVNSFRLNVAIDDSISFKKTFRSNDIHGFNYYRAKNSMTEGINDLDEVVLELKPSINAVSLGIIPKPIKRLTQMERRLYTAGDFKWYHLFSILGGSLQVDPIINAISGRTKRIKGYIKIEKKLAGIEFIEENCMPYLRGNLGVSEDVIGRFITYLVEDENFKNVFNGTNDGTLQLFMDECWMRFNEIENKPNTLFNISETVTLPKTVDPKPE